MIDEIFDRNYNAGRHQLSALLARGFAKVTGATMDTFKALNRIEYQAPWTARSKHIR